METLLKADLKHSGRDCAEYIRSIFMHTLVELTEVSALWFLKVTRANGSEVPEISLGAKSL